MTCMTQNHQIVGQSGAVSEHQHADNIHNGRRANPGGTLGLNDRTVDRVHVDPNVYTTCQ
eukprot:1192464-Prorocentrum_minimum.AAC.1